MPTEAPPILSEDIQTSGKKTKESSGIIAMMDSLIKDLDMEMIEAEVEEKDAQEDHEESTVGNMQAALEQQTADLAIEFAKDRLNQF